MKNISAKSSGKMLRRISRGLQLDRSGVAMIEFAFAFPLVLTLGMLGAETTYLVITHMQVSQIAVQVADNTSRIGTTNVLAARQIFERDVNEAFVGAERLGENIDVLGKGRVIISSLQQNTDGGQWVAWQRCRGAKVYTSGFGVEGDGDTGTDFPGMGRAGREITAPPGDAVMFVEVAYDYDALTPFTIFDGREITYTAAFNVRDPRDLIGGPDNNGIHVGGPRAECDEFSAARPS